MFVHTFTQSVCAFIKNQRKAGEEKEKRLPQEMPAHRVCVCVWITCGIPGLNSHLFPTAFIREEGEVRRHEIGAMCLSIMMMIIRMMVCVHAVCMHGKGEEENAGQI